MKSEAGQHSVKAWQFQGVLLELYRRAPGSSEALPRHLHEEYQLTLNLTQPDGITIAARTIWFLSGV